MCEANALPPTPQQTVKILDKEKRLTHNTRFTIESLRMQQKLTKTIFTKEDVDNITAAYITALPGKLIITSKKKYRPG